MTNKQLQLLVADAATGTWPVYLGLHTDGEKIQWLIEQAERLVNEAINADETPSELDELDEIRDCDDCDLCKEHA